MAQFFALMGCVSVRYEQGRKNRSALGGGEGQIPGFPSKNARRKNRRKFIHRNGQRGGGETQPEY